MDEQDHKIPDISDNSEPFVISYNKGASKNPFRFLFLVIALFILIYLIYSVAHLFLSPDRRVRQIYLVPENAAFIIESSNPVDDWKRFSHSDTWQAVKKAKALSEIAVRAERIDSIVLSNKNLLSLVGKRDMLLSIHKTRSSKWDFLIILDMQKASKLDLLKEQIELILRLADFEITYRTYYDIPIIEMHDPDTREILYAAFVDNHFVASYTPRLVEASIDARGSPKIGLEHNYIEAEKQVAGKGLYRLFVNYAVLPDFMRIYLNDGNESMDMFCQSMDFAGFFLNANKNQMELKGITCRKENANPYVTAVLSSGKQKMKAHEIMSARTAVYSHLGIEDVTAFVQSLEKALANNDPALYTEYNESRQKIEKTFDISLNDHFLQWMSGEFAISQSEPGLIGREPEYILAIGAKNIKDAKKNMEVIGKKIKARTPIKVKTVNYKGFDVNYIEMKGFFRLFFGKMFDRFEKPYYTYIGNYVVFSNRASTLLSFIEDYEQKNRLADTPGFKKALSHAENQSTFFFYMDLPTFYPQLQAMVNPSTLSQWEADKNILFSFPYWMAQIIGNNESATLHYVMDYEPYTIPVITDDPDKDDSEMNEEATSEKELMNELERFYIEKFQGNVLRDFYPDGALKSETEIREGKRHGRYRQYYMDGKLKVRGKYVNNRAKGTWKYYTEEGKFERKEKF